MNVLEAEEKSLVDEKKWPTDAISAHYGQWLVSNESWVDISLFNRSQSPAVHTYLSCWPILHAWTH